MLVTTTLQRQYNINGTLIPCPLPTRSLEESVRALCQRFPMFRHTKVFEEDGVVDGEKVTYTLVLPPPKTNG